MAVQKHKDIDIGDVVLHKDKEFLVEYVWNNVIGQWYFDLKALTPVLEGLDIYANEVSVPSYDCILVKKKEVDVLLFAFKLSDLKLGEKFKFKEGQIALYYTNGTQSQELETEEHMEFIVLKRNPTSVKCKMTCGRIEYTFKFSGYFSGYIPVEDNLIIAKT